jgi:hypothetical protein
VSRRDESESDSDSELSKVFVFWAEGLITGEGGAVSREFELFSSLEELDGVSGTGEAIFWDLSVGATVGYWVGTATVTVVIDSGKTVNVNVREDGLFDS